MHGIYETGYYYKDNNSPLSMRVSFKGKYWSDTADDWVSANTIFVVRAENSIFFEYPVSVNIQNTPFTGNVPLYEELGQGYAVRFGKRQNGTGTVNTGTGKLKIELFVNMPDVVYWPAPVMWLQDFNMNLVSQKDSVEVKPPPQSPSYSYGSRKKPAYDTVTDYLMSEYGGIESFSQVYTDSDGISKLANINYSLPVFRSKGVTEIFSVSERPEQHQLRIIKELVSSQATVSDIIPATNIQSLRQTVYNNKLLVRDSYTIDCLNNICNVDYLTRRINYT
jgi:hypothetical protein